MQRSIGNLRLALLFLEYKIKLNIKRYLKALANPKTIFLFGLIILLVGSEVWVPILLGYILHNNVLIGVGYSCLAFWAGPATPFFPICLALTLGIRSLGYKLRYRN